VSCRTCGSTSRATRLPLLQLRGEPDGQRCDNDAWHDPPDDELLAIALDGYTTDRAAEAITLLHRRLVAARAGAAPEGEQ
jgi:hypothetical protein